MLARDFTGGFADPVFDSQAVFRAVLDAMTGPGVIQPLPGQVAPPAPLNASAGAIVLALADAATPIFLDTALAASPGVVSWIGFHTGAPIVPAPAEAAFAVLSDPSAIPALSAFAQGTAEYPDRSATLIVQIASLQRSREGITLRGPGIDGSQTMHVPGLPVGFSEMWALNRGLFPLGVDILFASAGSIAALPRTAEIIREASAQCM